MQLKFPNRFWQRFGEGWASREVTEADMKRRRKVHAKVCGTEVEPPEEPDTTIDSTMYDLEISDAA